MSKLPILSSLKAVMMLAVMLVIAGCAVGNTGSDDGIPANYPTIAPAVVHGRYEMTEVVGPSGPVVTDANESIADAPAPPVVEFDVVTGELRIEPVCNQYLGSFTLDPDGTASFTITGGTGETCADAAAEQQILAAFDGIDQWIEAGDGLELSGPGPTLIRLRRA